MAGDYTRRMTAKAWLQVCAVAVVGLLAGWQLWPAEQPQPVAAMPVRPFVHPKFFDYVLPSEEDPITDEIQMAAKRFAFFLDESDIFAKPQADDVMEPEDLADAGVEDTYTNAPARQTDHGEGMAFAPPPPRRRSQKHTDESSSDSTYLPPKWAVASGGWWSGSRELSGIHHYAPTRLGITMEYRLKERWTLEGGLVYTRLKSDLTLPVDGRQVDCQQVLRYIGVPLTVNYSLLYKKHFRLYAAMGAMAEIHLSATRTGAPDPDSHPFQMTGLLGVGAELHFLRWMWLYAQPGLYYHFDNFSSTPNLYQDKRFGLDFKLGLRFPLKLQ